MYAYPNQGCSPGGCIGCAAALIILSVPLLFISIPLLIAVAIGAVIFVIVRWLVTPQPRQFGAWPLSRWSMASEQAVYHLERLVETYLGMPLRVLVSSFVLVGVPLLVVYWFLFSPTALGVVLVATFGLGIVLARRLSQHDWNGPETSLAKREVIEFINLVSDNDDR